MYIDSGSEMIEIKKLHPCNAPYITAVWTLSIFCQYISSLETRLKSNFSDVVVTSLVELSKLYQVITM